MFRCLTLLEKYLASRSSAGEQEAREPPRLIGKRSPPTEIEFGGTVFGSNTGKLFPFANKPRSLPVIIASFLFRSDPWRFCGISCFPASRSFSMFIRNKNICRWKILSNFPSLNLPLCNTRLVSQKLSTFRWNCFHYQGP